MSRLQGLNTLKLEGENWLLSKEQTSFQSRNSAKSRGLSFIFVSSEIG
ncbi:hypothetical protein M595_5495 [Lyngbya aestuarii BL J]|uniref:Uncharacterized protein n=1 Tax=Lyngbya aestuarii BL J TaxID=1348334 RepID=U7Q9R0_9CYAN|nr:hypothetical protein M595_6230 [Lyngbya aestuarii BL J]ERT04559.1 hypothetical protein M595_5495 [Lyngbya aestuarii BL J]